MWYMLFILNIKIACHYIKNNLKAYNLTAFMQPCFHFGTLFGGCPCVRVCSLKINAIIMNQQFSNY